MTTMLSNFHELDTEIRTFEKYKNELLQKSRGQYVLIKSTEIIDIYPNQIEAVAEGTRRFGNQPFYVKRIVEYEEPTVTPSTFSDIIG